MSKFRPCIDLHNGIVKQIVGSTLTDFQDSPKENFIADHSADWFASKYKNDKLFGGHVIQLGPGNEEAARRALSAFSGGLQIGGGVDATNAEQWLEAGASHVIVTSWLFDSDGHLLRERLDALVEKVGKDRLVIDLSCKRTESGWTVAMNRWQTLTDVEVTETTLDSLSNYCDEFLIHAADVEGLCKGIDVELVKVMGDWGKIPMTYAGGVATMADVELVATQSNGKVDVTVGSALDLFGGSGVLYDELLEWNARSN